MHIRYSLRQLDVFLAVAHYQNVTRAAESLSMSQSAASGALKELEQQFDMQLFDRMGKRLQLNELGKLIRPKAEALLEQARALEEAMSRHNQMGHLKLGATLTIGNYLAVDLIAAFKEAHQQDFNEETNISLQVANTEQISRKLLDYEIDIALIEGEINHPQLEIQHWRDDELVVFCSPKHPWAKRKTLNDKDLIKGEWIVRETGSGTRQSFDRAMAGLLNDMNIAMELQHTEAIKRAVATGMGVSCLSRITIEDNVKQGILAPLKVPQRDFKRAFYLALHREKFRSATVQAWLDFCKKM